MDEQKSNCEENDSEKAADDSASSNETVPSHRESETPFAAENISGTTVDPSNAPAEIVRACALCNCLERSLHGQRELRCFGPSSYWPNLEPSTSSLPLAGNDDLSSIGFSEPISPASFFDDKGMLNITFILDSLKRSYWVHYWCAVWSEGVQRGEGEELINVDKAVISGIQQPCDYCKRMGATIRCRAAGCSRSYHFPCSAASGSFQSIKHLALLCPEHKDQAQEMAPEEARCEQCDSTGELPTLVYCTGCGHHYHDACLEISATPLQRSGWQCPDCKVCQTCRQPGEDSKILVCDACDKGYHTFCMQPAMDSVPPDSWKCKRCRVCTDCGARGLYLSGSEQWFESYSVCERCQRQRMSVCGVCSKVTESSVTLQHRCSICQRWVHSECASVSEPPNEKCICIICREAQTVVSEAERPSTQGDEKNDPEERMELVEPEEVHECITKEGSQPDKIVISADPHLDGQNSSEQQTPVAEVPDSCVDAIDYAVSKFECLKPAVFNHIRLLCFVVKSKWYSGSCVVAVYNNVVSDFFSGVAQGCSESVADGAVSMEDEPKAQVTVDSHPNPVADTMLEAELKVQDEIRADDVQLREGVTREEGKELSSNMDVTVTESTPVSLSPSPRIPLPAVSDEVESVVMDISEPGSEVQIKEMSDRTSPLVSLIEPSASDTDERVGQSEDDEEEDELLDEDPCKDECQVEDAPKQEADAHEMSIKSELLLDEMSNLSHGDESSSGFLGSPAEVDSQMLSMDLGAGRARSDSMLTESDEFLPFDSLKCDGEKLKRRGSPGRSRVKQHGRGAGFQGKRRPRGGGGGRGRGRSRLKAMASCIDAFLQTMTTDTGINKEEEEEEDDTMQNTVVLFSSTDKFVLLQDMCVVCGSFGRGLEGQLLACAQCSQCYHPYCVNSKITKMMLRKGWRCLECIVCEVCGKASDPARLLLCDDCDVSYHTYCLDPPLHTVPKGGWKCKWCVCCMNCGASSPGFHCEWQNNYNHCGPCASLVTCPVCHENFMEEELLLQCQHCDRWVHAVCESLYTEDEVEQASDEGFACTACTPYVPRPVVESPMMSSFKIKEPEPQFYRLEGVWLTETGMSLLRSISMSPLHKRRQRRSRLGTICLDGAPDSLELKEGDGDGEELKGCAESMDCDSKLEAPGSPDRDGGMDKEPGADGGMEGTADSDVLKGADEMDEGKKRKRKPYRPGIGGFMVRQRKCHTRMRKSLSTSGDGVSEGQATETKLEEGKPDVKPAEGEGELAKKRRGRKKSKLEDMFPAYLQEAFFGKTLLDLSKRAFLAPPAQKHSQGILRPTLPATGSRSTALESVAPLLQPYRKMEVNLLNVLVHLSLYPMCCCCCCFFFSFLMKHLFLFGLGLPQGTEKQDSEQFFRKVLGPSEGSTPSGTVQTSMKPVLEGESNRSGLPLRNFPGASTSSALPSASMMEPFQGLSPSPFFDPLDRGGIFSPEQDEESPWATPSTPATPTTPPTPTEQEGDGLSYNQRSLQRWEKDEELGNLSTISPVLYANINFPNLKQDYPDWASRCKQIMKIWRKVSAPDKVPFLQKAKDNRAAQRISKAQKQAESQVLKPVKTEPVRIKAERPNLHLQIPPPSASLSTPSQPSSAESAFPFTPDTASSVFSPDGSLKASSSTDIHTDSFSKPPSQSPHAHSQPSTPYLQPSFSPLQASSGYPLPGPQGASQGRPASLGSHDMHPGMPRKAQQVDPFFKPQQQILPLHPHQTSRESVGLPESPRPKAAGTGDLPLFSPSQTTHHGDPIRGRQEYTSSSSPSTVASSPGGMLQNRADMSAPSPRPSAGLGTNSPAGMGDSGDGLFKAPMTPRMHQGDQGSSTPLPPNLSPNHPPESYRQSPSAFSDSCVQSPLTPRPHSADGSSPLLQRPPIPQQESYPKVASSPQSRGSSPLTPGALSNDGHTVHSPATPRFQSPDPHSRPPSRPQSRDPFTSVHKPPCTALAVSEAPFRGSLHSSQQPLCSPSVGDPLSGNPLSGFSRSPSLDTLQISQPQAVGSKQLATSQQAQVHQQSSMPPTITADLNAKTQLSSVNQDTHHLPVMPGTQELPDLSAGQDQSLIGLSPSEVEKHRQKQRLREFLIRQKMQRNSLRQEKEASAPINNAPINAPNWQEGEMAVFQQDKSQRAPPPYPQDRAAVAQVSTPDKLSLPMGTVDETQCRPHHHPGTPGIIDPNVLSINIYWCLKICRQPGPSLSQGMYPRPAFPAQWQGQVAGPRRFPQPSMMEIGPRHHLNSPLNNPLNMQGMPSPLAVSQGTGPETMQHAVSGPPPQFIELKHNAQRLPIGHQFLARTPQPRPRLFIPQQDVPAGFVPTSLPPSFAPQGDGGHASRLGLPQANLGQIMTQQTNIPPSQHPLQPQEVPSTHANTSVSHSTIQQLSTQNSATGEQQPSDETVDLPEADLEDHFAAKALGESVAEAGVEDEDDLALDLDPDKGDDDLGNLDNLETNDPHLDDLLNSDEFDLLAYTDPELDQGDPKDVFSDQLRLVEAEGEGSGTKAEEKPKVGLIVKQSVTASTKLPLKTETSTPSGDSVPPKTEASDTSKPVLVKLEEKTSISPQQSAQTVVKDEMGEAVSLLLSSAPSKISTQPENSSASLSTIRLGGIPFPPSGQVNSLTFPPSTPHPDLPEDPLGLPDGGGEHSPAVDLDKVESSLEASELPLLIQDLLEHEKKELQKQQQQQHLNALQGGGITSHLHNIQNQQQPSGGPGQILLPHHRPPQGLVSQPGMVPRPPHMLNPQQQRMLSTPIPPPTHMAVVQPPAMIRAGQPSSIHPTLDQQQQAAPPQHHAKPQSVTTNFFPDKDLDKFMTDDIMDPIAKAKMVALKGIKRVLTQDTMTPGINRQQASLLAQRLTSAPGGAEAQAHIGSKEGECSDKAQPRPTPPQFVQGIINDAEQHQYEEWLVHTQQLLQMQLKFLEEQIGAHRKSRKALCAKQRTAKKAGREFAEADAEKLKLVTEEQSKIQKQLDQVRKQQKEHTNLIAEYRSKQQQHQQGSSMPAPGPSSQAPHMLSKMPGQMIMGQQGGQMIGQVPGGIPQGGMPVRMPQVHPFSASQTPHPAALGTGPPGPTGGFFPQGTGAQVPDPRLIQERQMQQRMMVQKLQQQFIMGQQPVTHQSQQPNQQAGPIGGPAPQAMMSNALIGQQQPNLQPGLISKQQHQQGLMQVPQGMMGTTAVGQAHANIMAQPMTPNQNIMAGQQGMVGNQPLQQLQRPQSLMGQQVSSEPQHVLRGPQGQFTGQQQSVLAQRMLLSQQQQNAAKNLGQLQQQQQIPQQRQLIQMGASEQQGTIGSSPSSGIQAKVDNLQQAVQGLSQDVQSPASKDSGILSPKTPPQQAGTSTPIQMQQGPSGDMQVTVGHQPPTAAYMVPQQATQQQPGQNAGSAQHGYLNNQQTGLQPQEQMQLALQRQNSLNTEQVKQEGQQMCYVAQQLQQGGQNVAQIQGMIAQQSGQNHAVITGNPNQQQVVVAQQQLNRSQQIMITQRTGAPPGQIQAPINIRALIAQNPQLCHLPPNQQLQQIQAIIAQRQAQQQGQMLRLQGQTPNQIRNQGPQPVVPRMPGLEAQQQHPYAFATKQGPVGSSQQQGVVGQPSVIAPQFQNAGSLHPQQTSQGVSPQYNATTQQQQQMMQQQHQMMRGQVPLSRPMMGQVRPTPLGHMARPMSPRQLMGQGSPGSPHSGQQRQIMGMRQTPPGQGQCLGMRALSPFQASPSHVGSPAGSTVQEAGSSPASFNKHDFGTASVSNHPSPASRSECGGGKNSPFSNVGATAASPLRSPIVNTPQEVSGLKSEPQLLGAQKPTSAIPLNGPSPKLNLPQASVSQPVVEGEISTERDFCKISLQNIKQEPREVNCDSGNSGEASSATIKRENAGDTLNANNISGTGNLPGDAMGQIPRTETGQQLLQKLLRTKSLQLPSQRTADGIHNEINGHINSKLAMLEQKLQETPRNMEDLQSITKRPPVTKAKRTTKAGERGTNARKKNKKDEVGKTEAIMKQLKQGLSLLPLMEPSITASLDLFAPFGSSPVNGKTQLKGSFGNAVIDNIPDYYSQLLTKNNLSNPPTPPSSLPPTPPPSVQHKLLNGVTAVDELAENQKERKSKEDSTDPVPEEVKSVDILAALPTPPHNQNEDVRMESDDDSDVPDTIVPASSPESQLGDDTSRFPHLFELKEEEENRAISPVIPMIPRSSIPSFIETKPFEAVDGKPGSSSGSWDKTKSNEVSVTFTLSANAAKNLNSVMVAVAQLLQMRMPGSYEVAFPRSPGSVGGVGPGKPPDSSNPGPLYVKTDPSANQDAEWLKQFDVTLPGCTLKKQVDILSLIKQEYTAQEDQPAQHCYMTNVSDLDVRHLPIIPVEVSPPPSPPPPSPPPPPPPLPPASILSQESLIIEISPKPIKQRRPFSEDDELPHKIKKWKGVRWKRLHFIITIRKGSSKKENSREVSELMERLRITLRPDKLPRDKRKCCFCHEEGDGSTDGPARLLNIDVDLWVHLNCALWSTEVYETQGGALINVEVALRRGLRTRCACCQKTGATNSCNRLRCPNVYHFACAIRARCMFFKDKTMLCTQHKLKGPSEEELSNFAVFRRVYIERDEVKQIASILQRGDRIHLFRVGGLIFHAVGQLLPSQMAAFHSPTAIFPAGYEATRIYWSTRVPNRRCRYRCRISEQDGQPLFEVRVLEHGQEDLHFRDSSPDGIWNSIVQKVAKLREDAVMLKLFTEHVKGEEMYGLTVHAVMRITESLPGVENCQNYMFRYGRHPLMELPLMINPTGCARSEPKILTHCKRPHTLNSTSMSKAYQSTFTGEINTPYSKQFVHSKSSQYRRLKTEWKNNVYLARSRIQGLGLYAAKDLEKHTMVIEYIGTIIRNEVANRREKIYEEQNRGIYMFRINNEHVIDATLTGGPARYVNHSCAPNCVAEVVTFDKEDKIIIISSRRIPKGEELTYDYQFDFEDDQHKIPCHCGAWNCRKWMN
ncbi:histone-lysine N-methyltransferase 2D isoform X1, partial [Silurus asotus]